MREMSSNLISIPVLDANTVQMRYSQLPRTGKWDCADLNKNSDGWYEIDISTLKLPDGAYEYEFVINGKNTGISDPYAEEITRYKGTRGIFRIKDGNRYNIPFNWDGECNPNNPLPNNNEMVIYELPLRWIDTAEEGYTRQMGLGTFDKATFYDHWDYLKQLGINCIELLPIQDSPDTLNWGYGTRFFFAPDIDMGEPFDLKFFIKKCHENGIRVILDVVMNHSRKCPLEDLAFKWFYLEKGNEEMIQYDGPRPDWGGKIFKYRYPSGDGKYYARDFHYDMAKFWIEEYHIDGFRIDEFHGIDSWYFIKEFRQKAENIFYNKFPDRHFIVIAEDSWRHANITQAAKCAQNDRIVDAIWDFDFKDGIRKLCNNKLFTIYGQSGRKDRTIALIKGDGLWDDYNHSWRECGFSNMTQRVIYNTSHDVGNSDDQRLYNYYLRELIQNSAYIKGGKADEIDYYTTQIESQIFEKIVSTFAIMLTSPGIPMFLAGEEFADRHDLDTTDCNQKMSDPINWNRKNDDGRKEVLNRVKSLIKLRTKHSALHGENVLFKDITDERSSIENGFHKNFDDDNAKKIFCYVRTGGMPIGSPGQVVVISNLGSDLLTDFSLTWSWTEPVEHGGKQGQKTARINEGRIYLDLNPYQVRVFSV